MSFLPPVSTEGALEFVEDAIVLVKIAKLLPKVIMYVDRFHRLALHRYIPDLQCQVIS